MSHNEIFHELQLHMQTHGNYGIISFKCFKIIYAPDQKTPPLKGFLALVTKITE